MDQLIGREARPLIYNGIIGYGRSYIIRINILDIRYLKQSILNILNIRYLNIFIELIKG